MYKKLEWSKNHIILFIAFLIITLLVDSFFVFNRRKEKEFLTHFEKIQQGDLVLRCGRTWESYTVYIADDNADFSHIGIIVMDHGIPYVIHAVPDNDNLLKKEKLTDFLSPKNCSNFSIFRGKFRKDELEKVVDEAELFYNKKYTFDNAYDLKTDTKLYCTELIVKAFKNAGLNLNIHPKEFNYIVGKHFIILPSQFTKYPFYKVKLNN